MRLHILSDLHQELWRPGVFRYPEVQADVIILAGDIHRGVQAIEWIQTHLPQDRPILYVPGNHEFYGAGYLDVLEEMRNLARELPHLYLLEKEAVELGDVVFLGATLWTDFSLLGAPQEAMAEAREAVNDFHKIRVGPGPRLLHPGITIEWHKEALAFFLHHLIQFQDRRVVILTHHAPSLRSIHPAFRQAPLSAAFASNLESFICRHPNLVLWVHGHTHNFVDYTLCHTRIVSNPLGYPHESGTGFRPDFIVSL